MQEVSGQELDEEASSKLTTKYTYDRLYCSARMGYVGTWEWAQETGGSLRPQARSALLHKLGFVALIQGNPLNHAG